jgi:hypothetical protein
VLQYAYYPELFNDGLFVLQYAVQFFEGDGMDAGTGGKALSFASVGGKLSEFILPAFSYLSSFIDSNFLILSL